VTIRSGLKGRAKSDAEKDAGERVMKTPKKDPPSLISAFKLAKNAR